MDNESISEIKTLIREGKVSKNELESLLTTEFKAENQQSHPIQISQILYVIGGIIVYVGIATLLSQRWLEFSFVTRLIFTLGLSFVSLIAAVVLAGQKNDLLQSISLVHFIVAELTLPLGLWVVIEKLGYSLSNVGIFAAFAFAILLYNVVLYFSLKRDILVFFSIIWGVAFYFSFSGYILRDIATTWMIDSYFLVFGICFVILTYSLSGFFERTGKNIFRMIELVVMDLFGLAVAYYSLFSLAGWKEYPVNIGEGIAEFAMLPAIILGFYFSFKNKNYTMMVVTSIVLFIYIIKIVQRYLYNKLLDGPVAFILAGLTIILSGFVVLWSRNYYLQKFSQVSS